MSGPFLLNVSRLISADCEHHASNMSSCLFHCFSGVCVCENLLCTHFCFLLPQYLTFFTSHTGCICVCCALCVCVWPPPFTHPAGSVSCACCADNQCVTLAGSVQQEQGTGLNILHTHITLSLTHRERHTESLLY